MSNEGFKPSVNVPLSSLLIWMIQAMTWTERWRCCWQRDLAHHAVFCAVTALIQKVGPGFWKNPMLVRRSMCGFSNIDSALARVRHAPPC